MSPEDKKLIEAFNANVEWLKKNQTRLSVPVENNLPEWINVEDALRILKRGRTYLKGRMIEKYPTSFPINTNWFLIKGVDYERENNKILVFKSASIVRLKSVCAEFARRNPSKLNVKTEKSCPMGWQAIVRKKAAWVSTWANFLG